MTAIEWLYNKMYEHKGIITITEYEQAKEMEKKQIIEAVDCCFASLKLSDDKTMFIAMTAEQYYNETFKNTEK